uniref:Aquaporin n=1 Tax=Loa loa TaxID=7209 RepID=A0A1I7VVT7_LOALO
MFDVNLILQTYGLFGIFIEITAIEIANAFFLRDAIAHPCPLVTTASRKRLALRMAFMVALTIGSLIEGLATFSSKAVEFFANEWYTDSKTQMLINCMFAGFLTTIGMYANPIVAWACTFNCTGVTHLGHLIVYWLSPLIGWFLGDAVFGEQECAIECFTEENKESDLIKLKNS